MFSFDILIDKNFKPWLLEVNHAPSFNDDTEVDKIVKTDLITDTFRLLDIKYSNRQRIMNKDKKHGTEDEFKKYEDFQLKHLG